MPSLYEDAMTRTVSETHRIEPSIGTGGHATFDVYRAGEEQPIGRDFWSRKHALECALDDHWRMR